MNWLLIKNSFFVASLTTVLVVSLGFVAALWVTSLGPRSRNLFLALAVMALALPPFLVTNCWLHFLGHTGVWRGWLPFDIFSLGGSVWILTLLTWPITLLMVWSAWTQLESSQLESDSAVSGWTLIRGILLPIGRPAIAQAAVLTFVLALNNFAVPAILQTKVFPDEVWIRFNTTFDTIGAIGLSWPLILVPLVMLILFARRGFEWPRTEGVATANAFRRQLGRSWLFASGVCAVALAALSLGLPLVQLSSAPRTWSELPGALAAGQSALWNSILLAALSATFVIGLSFLIATLSMPGKWTSRFNPSNPFNLFNAFLWLPFLIPGVLIGIFLIAVFNRPILAAFYQSIGIVILAFVIRYFALGWNTVAHSVRSVDPDLTEAARLSGANRWQILRHVHWPQIASQIAAAWYIVYLLCIWDVESMILVVPPGGETLALRIFNLLHYGHNAQVNALCVALLGVAVAPVLLFKAYSVLRVAWARVARFQTSRNTQYATLTALLAGAAFLLAGCNLHPSSDAPLESQIFSRVQIVGSRGVGVGQLNKPRSVAVDSQDNLFVVDMTGRVQKFSPNGLFLLSWQMPQTDLGKPKGMGRDRNGNIVVVEPHYQRINHFTPQGKLVTQWGAKGTNVGQFTLPRAVAINSHKEIFISEYGPMERVQCFSLAPNPNGPASAHILNSFGQPGNNPGDFNRPEGLCVDSQDRLFVADSCNHRIQIFSREGKLLRMYGKAGSGPGELSYPYDICVDNAGRQYVCEFGNSRIQIFDANDRSIEIIGGPGSEPGQFSNPWGVALDSAGNLYVADSQNHRVQKLIRKQSLVSNRRGEQAQSAVISTNSIPSVIAGVNRSQTPVVHHAENELPSNSLSPSDGERARVRGPFLSARNFVTVTTDPGPLTTN
jgi:ABC-type Fe3+ transport system permease subunit/DNA-binding beta-propeller fold protein YncE